jgi:hypothetical protein
MRPVIVPLSRLTLIADVRASALRGYARDPDLPMCECHSVASRSASKGYEQSAPMHDNHCVPQADAGAQVSRPLALLPRRLLSHWAL